MGRPIAAPAEPSGPGAWRQGQIERLVALGYSPAAAERKLARIKSSRERFPIRTVNPDPKERR